MNNLQRLTSGNKNSFADRRFLVGVDATRNRSGGAIAHLRGLLDKSNPTIHGIHKVHLWAYDELLNAVGDKDWLIKHRVAATNSSIIVQLLWQYYSLPRMAKEIGINILFNTDAGSVCPFRPSVSLSQDMLSFEPGEIQRFSWFSISRVRLELLRIVQLRTLSNSKSNIFLSQHAAKVIQANREMPKFAIIQHGIDEAFLNISTLRDSLAPFEPITCLYVSNAALYKHQWNVVAGIAKLRLQTGLDIKLRLVGGGKGLALKKLMRSIAKYDPESNFVIFEQFVKNQEIAKRLGEAQIFVYASSCENLPITLLEAMAAGLPIASSDRGPMPEILGKSAVYFDPENPESIKNAVHKIIEDNDLRLRIQAEVKKLANLYTWKRCADLTWQVIANSTNTD
jgi:glycosyltransferase involved in cell wall biosynthesis